MKNKTVKTLTLIGFFVLLAGFVAFKAGSFDGFLNDGDNTQSKGYYDLLGRINSSGVDSPPFKKTESVTVNPDMLPTSKSAVFIRQNVEFPLPDSSRKLEYSQSPKK